MNAPDPLQLIFVSVPDSPMGFVALLEDDYVQLAREAPSKGTSVESILTEAIERQKQAVPKPNRK